MLLSELHACESRVGSAKLFNVISGDKASAALKMLVWTSVLTAVVGGAAALKGNPEAAEIRRGPVGGKTMALVFTGHEFAESGEAILDRLAEHRFHASFFFTGDFLAQTNFEHLVRRIIHDGHYLGAHSDKHLLYCSWDAARTTLVTRETFRRDLQANLDKIAAIDAKAARGKFFLPPYEHSNADIARWTGEMGLTLVNYTPGTRSPADYTGEADKNFVPSKTIMDSIVQHEKEDPNGLNGFIILLHMGSGPGRRDKFETRFGELLDFLESKRYKPVRIDELLRTNAPVQMTPEAAPTPTR